MKAILITGASDGIGEALANRLAERKHNLVQSITIYFPIRGTELTVHPFLIKFLKDCIDEADRKI